MPLIAGHQVVGARGIGAFLGAGGNCNWLSERIFHGDPKVFLTGAQVLRPDSLTTRLLGGCHDHAIVEVDTVSRSCLHRSSNYAGIGRENLDRPKRIEQNNKIVGAYRWRDLVKESRRKLSQNLSGNDGVTG